MRELFRRITSTVTELPCYPKDTERDTATELPLHMKDTERDTETVLMHGTLERGAAIKHTQRDYENPTPRPRACSRCCATRTLPRAAAGK